MRTGWLIGTIVMVVAACGSAAATVSSHCGPRSATTLAVDDVARVYQASGNVYGCSNADARSYRLAASPSRFGQPRIGKLALTGVVTAYGLTRSGIDTVTEQIVVRRLDNGHVLHQVNSTTGPLLPEGFQSVDAIVVKADGAVAWLVQSGSIVRHSRESEVIRFDRRGEATLASSTKYNLGSLELRGSELNWSENGATGKATLY
jgi:hypothetical protein